MTRGTLCYVDVCSLCKHVWESGYSGGSASHNRNLLVGVIESIVPFKITAYPARCLGGYVERGKSVEMGSTTEVNPSPRRI